MANPVTVAEVQQHLRLGTLTAAEQAEIELMVSSATEHAEMYCNRAWTSGTSTVVFDRFPLTANTAMTVHADIQTITAITYYDTAHTAKTFTAHRVVNNAGRSKLYPTYGQEWPTDSNCLPANISVTYAAGNEATVPACVKSAILLMTGDLYENRENTTIDMGITAIKMSMTSERLLFPYKTRAA